MNFVDMTNEEWEEVRRHHDELVQMGRLELEAEEIRECRPAGSLPEAANHPVGRRLCELDDVLFGISH